MGRLGGWRGKREKKQQHHRQKFQNERGIPDETNSQDKNKPKTKEAKMRVVAQNASERSAWGGGGMHSWALPFFFDLSGSVFNPSFSTAAPEVAAPFKFFKALLKYMQYASWKILETILLYLP